MQPQFFITYLFACRAADSTLLFPLCSFIITIYDVLHTTQKYNSAVRYFFLHLVARADRVPQHYRGVLVLEWIGLAYFASTYTTLTTVVSS